MHWKRIRLLLDGDRGWLGSVVLHGWTHEWWNGNWMKFGICPCPKNASVWCIPVCPSACWWNELLQQIQHSLNVKMANHRWSACQYVHIQWGLFYVVTWHGFRCWEMQHLQKSLGLQKYQASQKLPETKHDSTQSLPLTRRRFSCPACAWYRSTLFEPSDLLVIMFFVCKSFSCSFVNPCRVEQC